MAKEIMIVQEALPVTEGTFISKERAAKLLRDAYNKNKDLDIATVIARSLRDPAAPVGEKTGKAIHPIVFYGVFFVLAAIGVFLYCTFRT